GKGCLYLILYISGLLERPISYISLNPLVTINAIFAPFLSKSAFNPTVVPCTKKLTSFRFSTNLFSPFRTPVDKFLGVVGVFAVLYSPFSVSFNTTSVNVPLMSTSSLYYIILIQPAYIYSV